MAKAIQLDFPARDQKAELQQRLADAPTEHAEAILEFIELLEVLHKRNVLSTLRGVAGAGENLITYISAAAAQPESIRGFRNLIALSRILGHIDPEFLDMLEKSVAALPSDAKTKGHSKAPGFLQIARTLWSPPVRRTLFAAGLVMAGVGHYLETKRRSRA